MRSTNDRGERGRGRRRPPANELFAAAAELVSNGAAPFRNTARRYSLCPADADDAYQRGLEILMTKAPVTDRAELRRWLHTVIKHEALALRRQRERLLGSNGDEISEAVPGSTPGPDEGAANRERAQRTGEALAQLKSSETQCLLLGALGYSYDEISARTGFSWTKVNRSMTEGRKRFFDLFGEIEAGKRCRALQPLLSSLCDGEVTGGDRVRVETHLRGCPSCRAALRAYRGVPRHLAELVPPAVVLPQLEQQGWLARLHDSAATVVADRSAALGHKVQQLGELLSAQKAAAVVASTAALTGGTVAHERSSRERADKEHASAARIVQAPPPTHGAVEPAAAQAPDSVSRTPRHAAPSDPRKGDGAAGEAVPAAEFSPERTEATPASAGLAASDGAGRGTDNETGEPASGPVHPAPAPEFSP